MSDLSPPTPRTFRGNQESSPNKGNKFAAADPNKRGETVPCNAELDRQLAVWDSMDKSLLTTLEEFEENILWRNVPGDVPTPSKKAIDTATKAVKALFYTDRGEKRADVTEDDIAQTIVDEVINEVALPPGLLAALSQHRYQVSDATKSKVDAALYPTDVVPTDGRPNWTHLRMFIEFKKGGVANDPFDDESDNPEAWAETRSEVRGQLLAYASNTFQYQHRKWLYSLLINGPEFRAMYWDRSGLIVTMATNYMEDPSSLLRILLAFSSLSAEQQGIDPSATLLSPTSQEYKLMDIWAVENPALDMPYRDLDDVSSFFGPGAAAPQASPSLGPAAGTRLQARQAAEVAALPAQPSQPVFKYIRDGFRDSLVPEWPRYKLLVGTGSATREFLVGKPVFMSTSMFGRGTRGYIAYDVKDRRFVFLKDSWRPFYDGVEPEGVYLRAMEGHPELELAIPTVVEHGDVLSQTTLAAEYMMAQRTQPAASSASDNTPSGSEESRGTKRPREEKEEEPAEPEDARLFIHYRIAVEEVCLKMDEFRTGKQLVSLIMDCITTHRDAYEYFDLLHRDISTGNLLILPRVETSEDSGMSRVTWVGFLTDWELAKYIPKDQLQRARQPERTGTWQFMSVAYVRHPERPVGIPDELESFFHVLLHHAIRYLRHSLEGAVTQFVISYFDTFQSMHDTSDIHRCSQQKADAVTLGTLGIGEKKLIFKFSEKVEDARAHPLGSLLEGWMEHFNARYRILDVQDEDLLASKKASADSQDSAPPPARETKDAPKGKPLTEGFPDTLSRRARLIRRNKSGAPGAIASSASASVADVKARKAAAKAEALSAETKEKAAKLDNHDYTLEIFLTHLENHVWPEDDVVADQLDDTYNPKKLFATLKSAAASNLVSGRASTASKKARLERSVHAQAESGRAKRTKRTTNTPSRGKSNGPLLRARPLKTGRTRR